MQLGMFDIFFFLKAGIFFFTLHRQLCDNCEHDSITKKSDGGGGEKKVRMNDRILACMRSSGTYTITLLRHTHTC